MQGGAQLASLGVNHGWELIGGIIRNDMRKRSEKIMNIREGENKNKNNIPIVIGFGNPRLTPSRVALPT